MVGIYFITSDHGTEREKIIAMEVGIDNAEEMYHDICEASHESETICVYFTDVTGIYPENVFG